MHEHWRPTGVEYRGRVFRSHAGSPQVHARGEAVCCQVASQAPHLRDPLQRQAGVYIAGAN